MGKPKNKKKAPAATPPADQDAKVQAEAGKVAIEVKEASRAGAVAEREARIELQQDGKKQKGEEMAKLAKAMAKSREDEAKQAESMAANRAAAKEKLAKSMAKIRKASAKEELEIRIRKNEALARREPVLEAREENRNGNNPRMLVGEAKAIEDECNAQLREQNMIINSSDGKPPVDVLS